MICEIKKKNTKVWGKFEFWQFFFPLSLPLEAIGRLLFGSGVMVAIEEMLILDDVSQTFGDNLPMELGDGFGGWDDGKGGGREQGSDGGPEGTGEVGWVGVIITELGRHLTVTIPVGSERNHSDRWRIRSVCLWWTWNLLNINFQNQIWNKMQKINAPTASWQTAFEVLIKNTS